MGPSTVMIVIHLNRLSMLLGLNIIYEDSEKEDDEGGIPNTTYLEERGAVTFAWLPDMYVNDNLREYIAMAKRKFEDCQDDNINKIISEAEDYYLST